MPVLRAAKAQSLLDAQQDLADAEQADDGNDKIKASHQLGNAEGQAQLAGDDVEADGREDKPDKNRYQ